MLLDPSRSMAVSCWARNPNPIPSASESPAHEIAPTAISGVHAESDRLDLGQRSLKNSLTPPRDPLPAFRRPAGAHGRTRPTPRDHG